MLVGPTIRRRRLGTELRRLREGKALKLEDVAVVLGVAPSTLSRIETGKAPTRTSYLGIMADLYGVADPAERRMLMELAREGQRKGWWSDAEELLPPGSDTYLGLEAEASALAAYSVLVVPGLVQTIDYAKAVIAARRPDLTDEQADRLAAVQARRQEVLHRADPMQLRLVLDESALLRAIGPAPVMRRQLEHLADASRQRHVSVQVLRLSAPARPVLSGSFGILSFTEPVDRDVLCAEGIRGQLLIEQRENEVLAMRVVFDALSAAALPSAASSGLISDLARSL